MERIIKRYGNRKLYDTRESRYITLEEIASYVRDGQEVTVVENGTGSDLTSVAFAQIILEEERRHSGFLSRPLLRQLIRGVERAPERVEAASLDGLDGVDRFASARVDDLVGDSQGPSNGGQKPIG